MEKEQITRVQTPISPAIYNQQDDIDLVWKVTAKVYIKFIWDTNVENNQMDHWWSIP